VIGENGRDPEIAIPSQDATI